MDIFNVTDARSKLYALIDQAAQQSEPIMIKGKRNNAFLISEDDWSAINETLYLTSISGMRESIQKGLKAELSDCTDESPF